MSQIPHDVQDPSERRPPVIAGELVDQGFLDPDLRSYDPLAGSGGPQRPHPAPLQPYAPQPGPGAGPMPLHPLPGKSVGVAFVLTFFFGPFGMFYATVTGALIMLAIGFGVSVLAGVVIGLISLATFGMGAVLVILAPLLGLPIWITSIIWGCLAASSHTERVRAQYAQYGAQQAQYGAQYAASGGYPPADG